MDKLKTKLQQRLANTLQPLSLMRLGVSSQKFKTNHVVYLLEGYTGAKRHDICNKYAVKYSRCEVADHDATARLKSTEDGNAYLLPLEGFL